MSDLNAFQNAIDQYRFDDAHTMIADASLDRRSELVEMLEAGQRSALAKAISLKERIIALGQKERYRELMKLKSDPSTESLLGLLAAPARQRSDVYLREAAHWAAKQSGINARRLADARQAIDSLDADLGRAILKRIDSQFLDPDGAKERDRLLIDQEALSMDLEEINKAADQVMSDENPPGRWWKRS